MRIPYLSRNALLAAAHAMAASLMLLLGPQAAALTKQKSVPSAPSNLTAAAVGPHQVNLAWQDNSSNETAFKIKRRKGPKGSFSLLAKVSADTLAYSDTTVEPGTTYFYKVKAVNASGVSPASNVASATPSAIAVSIIPPTATVTIHATQPFAAAVTGTSDTGVAWSVQEGAAGGSVTDQGLYTAPAAPGIYHVVATSDADPSQFATAPVTVQPPAEILYDCTPAAGCAQLSVGGDPVNTGASSQFYGNLDPCVRRDPNGGHTLYFMYSFPMVIPHSSTPTIEIHLASSSDHGATWTYLADVWPFTHQPDGNFTSHEVSSLAAQNVDGTTTWYAISHRYEVPPGGTPANPNSALYVEPVFTESTTYELLKADNPAHLTTPEDSQTLICGGTTGQYASLSNPNLTTISGDSNAVTWREPALIVQGDVLYLLAQAADANGVFRYIGVFAARTEGPMAGWQWRYLGKLFQAGDPAQALPDAGHPIFTEIDVTQRADGQVVAVMTAMDLSNQQKYGSRTAEVATLGTYDPISPPAMVRDPQGHLVFTGQFTASDLNVPPNEGPGASTYEAMEPDLGLLIARRYMQPNVHGFTFDTGQHP